jgi:hypothetical protein
MGVTYHCDICGAEAASLDNWQIALVRFDWIDPSKPTPPGGRTTIGDVEKWFDKAECRDQWCAAATLTMPVIPVGMEAAK